MSRRFSVLLGSQWVATSNQTQSVSGSTVELPLEAFAPSALKETKDSGLYDLSSGSKTSPGAVRTTGHQVTLDLKKVDAYQDVSVPHKNPHAAQNHIVEVLQSRRSLRITFNGQEVARSEHWFPLFEAGASPYGARYYIPEADVRMDLLKPSKLTSHCPYKGDANYYSIGEKGKDLVWFYKKPIPSCVQIKNTVCFYLEKPGFQIELDGQKIEHPTEGFQFDR